MGMTCFALFFSLAGRHHRESGDPNLIQMEERPVAPIDPDTIFVLNDFSFGLVKKED